MASDFSSGCTDAVDVLDEKEEGEISLEDVSSSEEGHPHYESNSKNIEKCPGCSSTQHCASWCIIAARTKRSRALQKKDAVQGKENCHHSKGTGLSGGRHTISTLQEKNDDLIPISSDSDMELVGLAESSVHSKSSKVKKKKKRRRPRSRSVQVSEVPPSTHENFGNINVVRHNPAASKENQLLKKHHREKSPAFKERTSPRRRRSSPIRTRSLGKNTRSPVAHTKSAATRKSSKRLKSPRRSPHRTIATPLHKRVRKHSSPSKFVSSPPSDVRFTKLLKKVRQLDMVGTVENDKVSNKIKEHGSSLKEKLSNILKTISDTSEAPSSQTKEDSTENKKKEKGEEEDDLNILRQKALETKLNKTNKTHESLNTESDIKGSSNNEDDDDDDEDLQLRLIALRSAVYKKHHNRIQRREKASKRKSSPKRTESPFSDSFINIVTDVEDDESPSVSPTMSSLMKDCMSLEDMELDSDLERGPDLDDAPYSPTDEVNNELISEAEQLGLDASDVSLININNQVRFSSPLASSERESTPSIGTIFCGSTYSTTTSNSDPKYPNSESTFSLGSPTKDPHSRIPNGEKPYSPSDTPVYDPDLSDTLLPQNRLNSCFTENLKYLNLHSGILTPVAPLEIDQTNFPTNGIISVDDFLDTDLDGSPLVPMEKDSGTDYNIPEHLSYQMLQPSYQPLYLSNTPNSMNDINQMPTLINNPFVSASVSRLNILHQEPKKPLFHSVSDIETLNSKVLSKPIKPAPLVKKQDALTPEVCDQFRERSMPDLGDTVLSKRVEKNEENNLTVNTSEEKFLNSTRKRKRTRRRRNSKKNLSEPEEVVSPRDQEKSAKQFKSSKTESKNLDVIGKSKNSVEKNLERNLETNIEKNSGNSQQRQYNRYNNNIIIIQSMDTYTTNKNGGQLSLPKNNIKDMGSDSKSFKEIRRRSIDEDEEALRASLIASLASRTKAPENVEPKPVTPVPKIVESVASKSAKPVSKIAETITSKPANPVSKITETVPPKPVNPVTKIAETVPAKPAALVPKVPVSAKTSNATLNKPTENIQIKQTNSFPAGPKKNILNSSVDSAASPVEKVLVNNSGTTNSILGKRRSSLVQANSPKKIMKKAVIPASIKVVNNAKRYQNSLMQKRLNLQKANSVFNARRIVANRSLRVLNRNQSTRSISPNVSASKGVDRIVINLDMDSDSETDVEDDSVAVPRKSSVERTPLKIPTTEFERSVEQFLRDVRQKQELAAASKPTNITLVNKQASYAVAKMPTNKGKTTLPATPLAVRHLPASKQEEYHRLKQEILEREQLKLQRTSGSQQFSDTNTVTPPGPLSPAGPIASSKQKAVSTVVTSSLPKALSNLSPSTNSFNNRNSAQGNVQGNSPDLSKKAMPKLRILTCEQVNMKFLQVQVNQNERRKVIIGGTNSPQKNILSAQRSEFVNQNMSEKEVIEIENNIITNKSLMTNKDSSKASTVITSKSKGVDKTYDSEASTVILSNNNTTLSNESSVNRSINSEASTLVLSQNSTTLSSEEKINSTTTTNVLNQGTHVDLENTTIEISVETPERSIIPPTATSTILKAPVGKKVPALREVNLTMKSTISKEPILMKASTIQKEPTTTKASILSKELSILNPPAGKTKVNSATAGSTIRSKSITAADTDKIMPSTSRENTKEKNFTLSSKAILKSRSSSKSKSTELTDREKLLPSTSGVNLKGKTNTQNVSKADKEKLCAVWDEIKDDVMFEKEKISMLDKEEQKRKLLEAEQNLVAKRYVVLDDLAEVSGSLRQWELEKDLQTNLTVEVRKLREQLREAEEKLRVQKERTAMMGSKVATVHEKMNVGRKECYKLAKICSVLGTSILGKKYKIPEAGVQLVNNRLKEVAQHTSQLCKKKNEMKSKTVSTEKSEKKESEITLDEREENIERHSFCESFSSCEKNSHSVSSDVENNQGDSQGENEPSDTQVSEISPLGCSSDNVSQHIIQESRKEKENESEEHSKDSSEKADNNENNKNTNSSSMDKQYSKSVMCHTRENSTQNQSVKSDKQSSKQAVRPYESILTHLKCPRSSQPDGILCPYQLRGSCHDEDCQFVHHPSH